MTFTQITQSSYRKCHSTETALTSVYDDILRHIDEKQSVILLLLDLNAGFDTIDHKILLSRLQSHLGVCDVALQWFRSYLSERKQSVLINRVNSKSMPLTCGVYQGSVLSPILFTMTLNIVKHSHLGYLNLKIYSPIKFYHGHVFQWYQENWEVSMAMWATRF